MHAFRLHGHKTRHERQQKGHPHPSQQRNNISRVACLERNDSLAWTRSDMTREHAGHRNLIVHLVHMSALIPKAIVTEALIFFFFPQLHSLVKAKTAQTNWRKESRHKREKEVWNSKRKGNEGKPWLETRDSTRITVLSLVGCLHQPAQFQELQR